MECRICLEDTPPFLTNVCGCRGSQQAIHRACLMAWIRQKPSATCDVCKVSFNLPVFRKPFWHSILFSETFSAQIRLALLMLCFSSLSWLVWFQRMLFFVYFASYTSFIPIVSKEYFLYWFQWILILPSGQVLFPLPSLILCILPTQFPLILCLSFYQRIWAIHVGIVGLLK
jgi:hypothetical protein